MNSTVINSTHNSTDVQRVLISNMLMVTFQVLNFFIGIPLNIYVIYLLTRAGGLDQSVITAINQSATEILFALSAPLFVLCMVDLCFIIPMKFFTGICTFARSMFQCCICLERYLAVVHPLTFLKFKPLRYRLACLFLAWTCVLTLSIAITVIVELDPLVAFGSFYLITVSAELFCCVSILKVLRQPGPGDRHMRREDSGMSEGKKKAFKVVFINLLTHLIQMLPLIVTFSLKNTLYVDTMKEAATCTMTVNIAAGLMPPLYFLYTAGKLTFKATNTAN